VKTWTGKEAPIDAVTGAVDLLDLAVMLGRETRFGNSGDPRWTVLHHSFLVATIWIRAGYPREDLGHALLHDAHEAYLRDIPAPVKAALRAIDRQRLGDPLAPSSIAELERVVDDRIYEALGMSRPDAVTIGRIKVCDLAALVVEAGLFGGPGCDCRGDVPAAILEDVKRVVASCFPGLDDVIARRGGAR
jgi:hypothetical protein